MSWPIIAVAAVVASLIATAILAEWIAGRAHPRKGLQWCDNSPRPPDRTIER